MSQRWHNDWVPLPGQAVFDRDKQHVAAVSRAPGNLDLFVIGFDNRVYSTFWPNAAGHWNGEWFPLPGQHVFDHQKQQIAAVSRAPGNLDLFVIGFDNRVYSTFWNDQVGWNPDWFPLPGQHVFDHQKQQIAAVSRAPGNLDLFVIGFDNRVYSTFWNDQVGWNPDWFPLPGQHVFDHQKQQIAAVSRAPGNLDLFVIGFDNRVYSTFWPNAAGHWNGEWFPLPGQHVFDHQKQQIAAVSRAPGNLDLFVIGFDNRVYSTFWNDRVGWNPDWFPLPGQHVFDHQKQQIAAVSRAPGNLDLFVIGFDNRVYSTFWPNAAGHWNSEWFPLPGQHVFDHQKQQIAAVSRAHDNLDLFVIGFDNHIWSSFWGQHPNDRPWSVILCRFKGDPADASREGFAERFFHEAFTPGTGGLIEYWHEVSHGGVDVTGSRVFGWVETDIRRIDAGGIGRAALIDAGIRAAQARGDDPLTGFHSQIVVYTRNWAKDGAPPGADWRNPEWAPFWIDGSADGRGRVCLTPPFDGNITAHEMGHGFGMHHDVGPGLTTASDYSDPACILSQNGAFIQPRWNVAFGPAVCLPHMVQKNWLPPGRLFIDDGNWMRAGITLPLAPISRPGARANLGIKLRNVRANPAWDYYLEYCLPEGWNRGVPGGPYLLIRRMVNIPGAGERPAYLMALPFTQLVGQGVTGVEPSGNVRFTAEVTNLAGPIIRVTAEAL
ncbi:hypothetical protein [Cupriavidus sp. L7L]|uniref:hypothetical protein n=1 Tax=Cupriavidus sp. L7L TaxID=2546443 RepID=UPI001055A10C|nr:hypothetical protein [Cupriavidus sp. L7L]TDF59518.1 hypothetical protein E1J61_34635 [Cupriavidus sp. L7L]